MAVFRTFSGTHREFAIATRIQLTCMIITGPPEPYSVSLVPNIQVLEELKSPAEFPPKLDYTMSLFQIEQPFNFELPFDFTESTLNLRIIALGQFLIFSRDHTTRCLVMNLLGMSVAIDRFTNNYWHS